MRRELFSFAGDSDPGDGDFEPFKISAIDLRMFPC
jgi:hypothetical protein